MDVAGQVKCFLDRLTSFFNSHEKGSWPTSKLSKGKKALFVQTQGADEEVFNEIHEKYQQYFNMLGLSETHTIKAAGFADPAQGVSPDTLNEAEKLALSLV